MKKLIKYLFTTSVALVFSTSCVNDDDFTIPTIKEVILSEDFENETTGSGSVEAPVAITDWINVAIEGTRLWHVRGYGNNKYAEFSSYYSNASTDPNDEIWLITPALDFTTTEATKAFSFVSKTRYSNSAQLKVLIATDFDGTTSGITSATWEELTVTLPSTDNEFVSSGTIDLSAYQTASNVRIAFKYIGSKSTGATTTFQIDDIKIFENN